MESLERQLMRWKISRLRATGCRALELVWLLVVLVLIHGATMHSCGVEGPFLNSAQYVINA